MNEPPPGSRVLDRDGVRWLCVAYPHNSICPDRRPMWLPPDSTRIDGQLGPLRWPHLEQQRGPLHLENL